MAYLTDERLRELRPNREIDRRAETIPRSDLTSLLDEVERHRAAQEADEEAIKAVVMKAIEDSVAEGAPVGMWQRIATRCAEQLATPAVQLSAEDIAAMQRLSDYCRTWAVQPKGRAVIDRLLAAHGAKP